MPLLAISAVLGWLAPRAFYSLNVRIHVKPERRDDFLSCIRANQVGTLGLSGIPGEPLASAYLFGEDENMPNVFHFHEQYRGREGFVAHTESPHFADWEAFAATDPFVQPPTVSFFTERGMPRDMRPAVKDRYCLNVRIKVKPERREDLVVLLAANRRGTLESEPLALSYCFGEDDDDPNTFHCHEEFEGREGFEAHRRTEHFTAWERFAATDPFQEPPEVAFFSAPREPLRR